jgi:hypothetical protein
VIYPGVRELTGTLTVGELMNRSAIDRIHVMAGGEPPPPHTPVDTRDFVRPEWRDGALTLVAMPAVTGLAPFEVANPTPCCAEHA